MTAKHLTGTSDIAIPPAASAMYERSPELAMAEAPEVIEWTDELDDALRGQVFDMRRQWGLIGEPDNNWDTPEPRVVKGKTYLIGNCNDWSPALLRRLLALPHGIPRGALRLATCIFDDGIKRPQYDFRGMPHMVLSITTTEATGIVCSLSGMQSIGNGNLDNYHWIAWEGHGGTWEGLRPVSLVDAFGSAVG